MSVYEFSVKDRDGNLVSLEKYKGKVLLVLNSATHCGFTIQYVGLQDLYTKYKEQGFEILDFPCNQFGNQAPGSDEEIHEFCVKNYGITFEQFAKLDVNGGNADPLFFNLRKQTGDGDVIKWNFTKFLIDKNVDLIKEFYCFEYVKNEIESFVVDNYLNMENVFIMDSPESLVKQENSSSVKDHGNSSLNEKNNKIIFCC